MATYYVYSGAGGAANGTSWVNAYTTLTTAFSGKSAGDVFYVAHDHAETSSSAVSLAPPYSASNPSRIICVNRAGSVPPVSADLRTTAQVTNTGSGSPALSIGTGGYYYGVIFSATGTGVPGIAIGLANLAALKFENCSLRTGSNATNITFGNNLNIHHGIFIELINTTLSFGIATSGTRVLSNLRWRNTPSALLGAAVPTTLLSFGSGSALHLGASIECIGVDLSAAGSGKTLVAAGTSEPLAHIVRFVDCKLDAAVTKSGTPAGLGSFETDFVRCGSSGVNYAVHRMRFNGTLDHETTIVRTGGASDGTTPIAWKVVTTSGCTSIFPFECPPIAIWNDTTGSAVTATVEGIGAALPTDAEVWLEVEYLGDASSPQGSFVNDGKADTLATAANQTSSSETWGGSTTAFKLAVTFTPSQRGWVYARVKVGKASSTFYVDPLVTLS